MVVRRLRAWGGNPRWLNRTHPSRCKPPSLLGTRNRVFAHAKNALGEGSGESDKLDRIRAIQAEGLKVHYELLRLGLSEHEAFEVECAGIQLLDPAEALPGESELVSAIDDSHVSERAISALPAVGARAPRPAPGTPRSTCSDGPSGPPTSGASPKVQGVHRSGSTPASQPAASAHVDAGRQPSLTREHGSGSAFGLCLAGHRPLDTTHRLQL